MVPPFTHLVIAVIDAVLASTHFGKHLWKNQAADISGYLGKDLNGLYVQLM